MSQHSQRRELKFENLSAAVADARNLLTHGYTSLGNWNLSQTLGHCSDWLRFPVEGYPAAPLPIRLLLWGLRITMGPGMRRKIIREQNFAAGKPTLPSTVKSADRQTDRQALDELERQVNQFEKHNGPWHASPLFGQMTKSEHRDLQLVHLAHHLSFLIPQRRES